MVATATDKIAINKAVFFIDSLLSAFVASSTVEHRREGFCGKKTP
jgi:hypothetical protein